jgi:hypothetical protein
VVVLVVATVNGRLCVDLMLMVGLERVMVSGSLIEKLLVEGLNPNRLHTKCCQFEQFVLVLWDILALYLSSSFCVVCYLYFLDFPVLQKPVRVAVQQPSSVLRDRRPSHH